MISQRTKPPFVGEFKPAVFDYTKILYTKRFVHRCAVQAADFHSKTYQSTLTLWFTFQLHWKIPKLDTRNVPALHHTHQTFFDGGAILALPMYFPKIPKCLQLSRSPFSSTSKKSKKSRMLPTQAESSRRRGKRLSSTISISSRVNMPLLSSPRLGFKQNRNHQSPAGFCCS